MATEYSNHSISQVHNILNRNKKRGGDGGNGPSIAFLPEGTHKIRWFFDPNGEVYREVMTGRVGKRRFLCPDFMAKRDRDNDYPECETCKIAEETDDWRARCRYNTMVYGFLYDTKNASEYWKPGQAYVILGNSKLRKSIVEVMEALVEDSEEMLISMLTPTVGGYVTNTIVTKGPQGGVSIQVLPKTVEPITLGEWYQPLGQVWIGEKFDLGEYQAAMKDYHASLEDKAEGDDEETVTIGAAPVKQEIVVDTDELIAGIDEAIGEVVAEATTEEEVVVEEEEVVAATPAKKKVTSKKKEVVAQATATEILPGNFEDLPNDLTRDDLPEECPGWAMYAPTTAPCLMCDHNIPCLGARRAQTEETVTA